MRDWPGACTEDELDRFPSDEQISDREAELLAAYISGEGRRDGRRDALNYSAQPGVIGRCIARIRAEQARAEKAEAEVERLRGAPLIDVLL